MTETEKKLWARVDRYLKYLAWVPSLRLVAVCNNLAFGEVDENSDIDLFIVARRGRLFFVRTLVTLFFHLCGVRRHGDKVSGRFCLSFFVDDSALNLGGIALKNDVYLACWLKSMKPILDDGVSGELVAANDWILSYFDDFSLKKGRIAPKFVGADNFLLDLFERPLRSWQLTRAKRKLRKADERASLVVSPHVLKFHNIDRRKHYRKKWFDEFNRKKRLNLRDFKKII